MKGNMYNKQYQIFQSVNNLESIIRAYNTVNIYILHITQLCIPYHTLQNIHITRSRACDMDRSVWYGKSISHAPVVTWPLEHTRACDMEFRVTHITRSRFSTLQIWNASLCNLDTTLITREIWKYLTRVAVFFETIHHLGFTLVVYVSKNTATWVRYFHISQVISVVSRLHNEAFHIWRVVYGFFIIHCWKSGVWCMDF